MFRDIGTSFNNLFDRLNFLVVVLDEQGQILYVNPHLLNKTGFSKDEILGKSWIETFVPHDDEINLQNVFDQIINTDTPKHHTNHILTKSKEVLVIEWNNTALRNEKNSSIKVISVGNDITEQLENEKSLKRQLLELEILHGITLSATTSLSIDELLDEATQLLAKVFLLNNYGIYLYDQDQDQLVMHESYQGEFTRKKEDKIIPSHEGIIGHVFSTGEAYVCYDVSSDAKYVAFDPRTKSEIAIPIILKGKTIGVINAESETVDAFNKTDEELLLTFAETLATAIEKIQLFESTQQQTKEKKFLYETAIATSSILDSEKLITTIYERIKELLPLDTFVIAKKTNPDNDFVVTSAIEEGSRLYEWEGEQFSAKEGGLVGWILQNQKPLLIRDLPNAKTPVEPIHGKRPARSWVGVPLLIRNKTIGAMSVQAFKANTFNEKHLQLLESLASQIAISMDNARLLEQTQDHLERLSALHDIDLVINSSLDLRVTLNILLDQVVEKLKVDAAAVLLLNPKTQLLNYSAGRGFRTRTIESYQLRLGEGMSGQTTMEKHLVQALNLFENDENMAYLPILQEEGFVSFYSVPLIAKGQVKGVLDIFNRSLLSPDQEWIHFLETLAGQAAIAIDNTTLLEDLQRSNIELTLAYDTTLEGWTRALDLRDQETEGHTQRVVEMTVRMAQLMGISEDELIHVRRGALLHDIGKMGIPDCILLKPGPLTEEEWVIMRKHPVFAYNLLKPITHLRSSLDIPYCHHEWWNGKGYPRQLKGTEIPLAARIFTVVDVWDALTSDRPYRKAWTAKKTLEYIEGQKGVKFDPQIVELFMKLIKNELFKKL